MGLPLYQQLLTGVEQAVDNLQPEIIADPVVVAQLQVYLGNTLLNLGNSSKAEWALLQAIPVLQAELGPHEPETIIARTYLADFYRIQGNLRKSIEEYQAIKDSCLPFLPQDHLYGKKILNSLAALYNDAGNYRQAIEIFEQILDVKGELNFSNREDLVAFGNLAMLYLAIGRTQESLSL
ncbi:MAG TPA: tetratricopeptide repeat protein [Gemmatales bacterium]|nr:tetratricopeptide repeat protein [Gemmatales bacterium]HMP16969.1 tetratricopeptide repeat protein [Gemmatales bacterium]